MKLLACGKTDIGLVRTNNEDCYFISEDNGLFLVADGMGGHAAGEVASDMAVSLVCEKIVPQLQETTIGHKVRGVVADSVLLANRTIEQATKQNPAWKGMGTTLTILLVQAGQAYLVHVGDSRLYRFHDGQLKQLSDDHSLVGDQLRRGLISKAEAETSNLRNVLLQAVGTTPDLEICQKQLPLAEKDIFMLCSDGLTDMLSDNKITALFEKTSDLDQLCDLLVVEAKAAGGKDNITVVLVQVDRL